MLKGYRSIVCAVVGLILLGAGPPKADGQQPPQASQEKIAPTLHEIATALGKANEPSHLDEPCEEGDDQRSSNLCAQWKAADSADSAANATWLFGALGSLIGVLTLGAASAAAYFAWQAADQTRQGNAIAHSSARAWITWSSTILIRAQNATMNGIALQDAIGFAPKWVNSGSTPAINVVCENFLALAMPDAREEQVDYRVKTPLPPQSYGSQAQISGLSHILNDEESTAFREQRCKVFFYSRVKYHDIANPEIPRISEICLEIQWTGGTYNDGHDDRTHLGERVVGPRNRLT